ncbi:hypothetical protein ACIREE_41090 [Streptomyces sp. NPDC102467]|uniref:hypothetical protein n=1 Tax=Streptomyces sp. NPDC102467 TaxID=3366179 RepID=UPI0037F73D68
MSTVPLAAGDAPAAPAGPIWKCADCDTNNHLRADAQYVVCGRTRPASRVRINLPSLAKPLREKAPVPVPASPPGPDEAVPDAPETTAELAVQKRPVEEPTGFLLAPPLDRPPGTLLVAVGPGASGKSTYAD